MSELKTLDAFSLVPRLFSANPVQRSLNWARFTVENLSPNYFQFIFELTMFSRKQTAPLMAGILSVMVTACGGSSGDSQSGQGSSRFAELPADQIMRIGNIILAQEDEQGFANTVVAPSFFGHARFTEYVLPLNQAFIDGLNTADDIGSCFLYVDSADDSQDIGTDEISEFDTYINNARILNAGSALTVTTPAGSWPNLVLNNDASPFYEFETDVSSLGGLPANSTLDIPGDEFPAFSDVEITYVPRLAEVALVNADNDTLTPDTGVTWAASDSNNADVVTTVSVTDTVFDNGIEAFIHINCVAADTGVFTFPENAQQVLAQYEISTDNFTLGRVGISRKVIDDSAVIVFNASSYSF